MHRKKLERLLYEYCIEYDVRRHGKCIALRNAPVVFHSEDGTWWRFFRNGTWSAFEYSAKYCAKLADEYYKNGGGY